MLEEKASVDGSEAEDGASVEEVTIAVVVACTSVEVGGTVAEITVEESVVDATIVEVLGSVDVSKDVEVSIGLGDDSNKDEVVSKLEEVHEVVSTLEEVDELSDVDDNGRVLDGASETAPQSPNSG
jgi:cobyrinic acid a,c-diamide synthase